MAIDGSPCRHHRRAEEQLPGLSPSTNLTCADIALGALDHAETPPPPCATLAPRPGGLRRQRQAARGVCAAAARATLVCSVAARSFCSRQERKDVGARQPGGVASRPHGLAGMHVTMATGASGNRASWTRSSRANSGCPEKGDAVRLSTLTVGSVWWVR